MAAPYNRALKLAQFAKETVRGTIVAATQKISMEDFNLTPSDAIVRPSLAKGLLLANAGNEVVTERGVNWNIPACPLILDQFQAWLAMTFKGAVAATGAMAPYTWTYTRDPTADPNLDTRSFELRMTDGATPSDWKFGFGMVSKLEIIGARGDMIKLAIDGFGRRLQTATATAALAFPAAVVIPAFSQSSVYIDDTFGAIGGSQILAQCLGWKFTIETGQMGEQTADVRSDQDFSQVVIDPANVKLGLEMDFLAGPSTWNQWATEKTKAEANALRACQVRMQVTSGVAYDLKLQGLFKYEGASVFPVDEQSGQQVAKLKLVGSTDDTNFAKAILINNVNTVP